MGPLTQSWEGSSCRPSSATACVPLGPPGKSHQEIHTWLPPMLDLQVPQGAKSETEASCHQCGGWGYLAKGDTEARCCCFGLCESLRNFRKVCSRSQDSLFLWDKSPEVAWVGPQAGRGGVSESPGQRDLCYPSRWHLCLLRAGRAQQRNSSFCLHLCVGASCSNTGAQREQDHWQVRLGVGPVRGRYPIPQPSVSLSL